MFVLEFFFNMCVMSFFISQIYLIALLLCIQHRLLCIAIKYWVAWNSFFSATHTHTHTHTQNLCTPLVRTDVPPGALLYPPGRCSRRYRHKTKFNPFCKNDHRTKTEWDRYIWPLWNTDAMHLAFIATLIEKWHKFWHFTTSLQDVNKLCNHMHTCVKFSIQISFIPPGADTRFCVRGAYWGGGGMPLQISKGGLGKRCKHHLATRFLYLHFWKL